LHGVAVTDDASAIGRGRVSGTPAADIAIDLALAHSLLRRQHPDLADLPLTAVAHGWDNSMFRLGRDLALRLPRRGAGARLMLHEQRWLPQLAPRLPLQAPAPLRVGVPDDDYPYPWSVVPWFEGETADLHLPAADQSDVLAAFFSALHQPAPADAPRNPWRGVPLRGRATDFERRAANVRAAGERIPGAVMRIWDQALAAPDDAAPTWLHGDPHPRNVLVREGRLTAVIDWGDLACGDRASDLAGVWMLLDSRASRARVLALLPEVTAATWARARGWAAFFGVLLLDVGLRDDPRMEAIARRTLQRLADGP
jgi:aminoglycoside phosphotransferase (APT) family kinase protein